MSLVLTRKPGSTIILTVGDEEIYITVQRCRKSDTRFSIKATPMVTITRAELRGQDIAQQPEDEAEA